MNIVYLFPVLYEGKKKKKLIFENFDQPFIDHNKW